MNKNTDAMNQTFTGTLLFNELPFDIVTKIFSGISQRDCLTCMTVCRSWYDQLPQYTQDTVWSKLFISSTTVLPQNNQRWKRCIGKHVKHIDFSSFDKEQELYLFLSQMYELGCDQMESLEFIVCVVPSQYVFLSILKPLQHTLKKLKFRRHGSDLNFLDTIKLFPNLTQFSFSQMTRRGPVATNVGREQLLSTMADMDNDDNVKFPNLTHLFMNNDTIMMQERLAPIVQKCPNLQYLGYGHAEGSIFTFLPTPERAYIAPEKIFSWCPNLIYLEAYNVRLGKYRQLAISHLHQQPTPLSQTFINDRNNKISLQSSDTITYGGHLRAFFIFESDPYYKPDKIHQLLLDNTNTLEYLGLGRCFRSGTPSSSWSSVLQNLGTIPALHTLVLDNLIYDEPIDSVNTMVIQCPTLQTLVINNCGSKLQVPRLNLPKVLRRLKQLRCLDVCNISLDWIDDDDNNNSRDAETREYYEMSRKQIFFQQLAKQGSKLHTVQLQDTFPALRDDLMIGLACLPTLEDLFLGSVGIYTREGFDKFVETLLYGPNNVIKKIHIINLVEDQLSDTALTLLGKLPKLQTLFLSASQSVYLQIKSSTLIEMLSSNTGLWSMFLGFTVFTDTNQEDPVELLERQLSPTYSFIKLANDKYVSLSLTRDI